MSKRRALEWGVFGAEPDLSGPERSQRPLSSLPVEKHFSIGACEWTAMGISGRLLCAGRSSPSPTRHAADGDDDEEDHDDDDATYRISWQLTFFILFFPKSL